jgi:energy-coupling factor transporter ATP-binding protein EcfA2
MPILDEIETFFAGQPEWQRRGYEALRSGQVVNGTLVGELAVLCITDASTQPMKPKKTPQTSATGAPPDAVPEVRLLGIENVQHINRLAAQQTLKLAADGLTIVYGDNGAGKTGYGRIVRQVCQARGEKPLLRSSVYEDGGHIGSAEIVFSVNGNEERTTISTGHQQTGSLRHFSIFDSAAAGILVNEQNATAFRPFGLDLLDRFTALAGSVKLSIEQQLAAIAMPLVQLADFPETTKAGQLVRGLTSGSGRQNLNSRLAPLNAAQEARREEVRALLAQAKGNDPAKLALVINAKATRYQQFSQRLGTIVAGLAPERLQRFTGLRTQTLEVEAAAEVARTTAFANEPLNEVGAPVWRQLWDAARAYSPRAGAGQPFAESKAGELCVLCAQPLSADAARRFQSLESFVQGELQAKAKALRKQLSAALDEFNNLPLQQQGDDSLLQELATENSGAASVSEALLTRARGIVGDLQTHHATGEPKLDDATILEVPAALVGLPAALRQRAIELQNAGTPTRLSALQAELLELDATAKLVTAADQVKKEAARLARREVLDKAKKFSTRAVTELSKRLTTQYVSEALCERFSKELNRLGLTYLDVRLSPSDVSKGKLFHRLTLNAKQDAPLREVVSEGEFRCLALAAFLAESGSNASGLLFDDPVSSLDHTWRDRIAQRLAEGAKVRQVVVFTHDIAFHLLLREAAESPSIKVSLTERCVERRGNAGAGFCREDAPWAGMKTSKRIGVLKSDLDALKKKHSNGDEHYERDVRDWYGRLHESWERAVEEHLFNDAVRRFSHSVSTQRLEHALNNILPDDYAKIDKGMTRASTAFRGHDGAAGLNRPVPTPEEAMHDLGEFEAWVKTKPKK